MSKQSLDCDRCRRGAVRCGVLGRLHEGAADRVAEGVWHQPGAEGSTESSTESTSSPLGGANQIDATIRMGVGDLTVSDVPSTTAAFTGEFTYNPVTWKPETSYQVNPIDGGAIGAVYVGQPESDSVMKWGETENTWKLALASGVPTNLSMKLGAGEADVDLSGVDVRFLEAVTGVGSTTIDLSGPRTADVDANITAGVGELTLRLPARRRCADHRWR